MRVFIVHGWGDSPDSNWYQWLKAELEDRGHEVAIPEMPNTLAPEMDAWTDKLGSSVGAADNKTYFVGHSIGCQTIMRYVSKLPRSSRIGGIIFVAGWIQLENLEDNETERIAKPWLTTPIDFSKIKEKTKNIKVFLSDDDPYGCQELNSKAFEEELGAVVEIESEKGHFLSTDGVTEMPEVLDAINSFISR